MSDCRRDRAKWWISVHKEEQYFRSVSRISLAARILNTVPQSKNRTVNNRPQNHNIITCNIEKLCKLHMWSAKCEYHVVLVTQTAGWKASSSFSMQNRCKHSWEICLRSATVQPVIQAGCTMGWMTYANKARLTLSHSPVNRPWPSADWPVKYFVNIQQLSCRVCHTHWTMGCIV